MINRILLFLIMLVGCGGSSEKANQGNPAEVGTTVDGGVNSQPIEKPDSIDMGVVSQPDMLQSMPDMTTSPDMTTPIACITKRTWGCNSTHPCCDTGIYCNGFTGTGSSYAGVCWNDLSQPCATSDDCGVIQFNPGDGSGSKQYNMACSNNFVGNTNNTSKCCVNYATVKGTLGCASTKRMYCTNCGGNPVCTACF